MAKCKPSSTATRVRKPKVTKVSAAKKARVKQELKGKRVTQINIKNPKVWP